MNTTPRPVKLILTDTEWTQYSALVDRMNTKVQSLTTEVIRWWLTQTYPVQQFVSGNLAEELVPYAAPKIIKDLGLSNNGMEDGIRLLGLFYGLSRADQQKLLDQLDHLQQVGSQKATSPSPSRSGSKKTRKKSSTKRQNSG